MFTRRTLLTALAGVTLTGTGRAHADQGQAPGTKVYLFNIPARPLHQALEAFGAVTGMALIYDSELALRRRSRAVIGLFTPEVALRMLLEGSGLAIRFNSPTDIMLVSTAGPAADTVGTDSADTLLLDTLYVEVAPGSAAHPDFTGYSDLVVAELKRALHRDARTANRVYQVQLDIKVDGQGQLGHPRFVKSSGLAQLDTAICRVIEATTLKTLPPKGMPQPIRFTIIAF